MLLVSFINYYLLPWNYRRWVFSTLSLPLLPSKYYYITFFCEINMNCLYCCAHIHIVYRWMCNLLLLHFLSSITLLLRVNYYLVLLLYIFCIFCTPNITPQNLNFNFLNYPTEVENIWVESSIPGSSSLLAPLFCGCDCHHPPCPAVPMTQTEYFLGPLTNSLCEVLSEPKASLFTAYSLIFAEQAIH